MNVEEIGNKGNLAKQMFPVGKLLDIQLKVIGGEAGPALIGVLNGHEPSKAIFFDNVSVEKVGFTTYLSGQNAIGPVVERAMDLIVKYKMGEDRDLNVLEQFLLSHVHNSVSRG